MAYTRIEPLPAYGSPLLKGATEGLSYIRQVNEAKRQEAQKRQDEIVKLLGDVDFPTAVNMQNKKMQGYLRKAAENSIMDILSKSAKRGGMVTVEERMEADRVVKTLENELASITQGEKEFSEIMEVAAKQPGKYSAESLKAYSDHYLRTGESKTDMLQYSPIAFSVMQNKALELFDKRIEKVQTLVGENMVTVMSSNLTDAEKEEAYRYLASQEPGYGVWEKQQFEALPQEEQMKYLKMTNGNIDKAARNWGVDTYAKDLIPENRSSKPAPESKLNKDKKDLTEIKGRKLDNGKMEYITGGKGQSYSGFIKTVTGEELSVDNAKISRIMFDPNDENYGTIEITAKETKNIPMSASFEGNVATVTKGGKESTPTTYIVPYYQLSPFINNNYNLLGLEQPKNKPKMELKKIEW
jgi:hypothetical protein